MYSSIFDGVNLGFHEAGHAAFMWFGTLSRAEEIGGSMQSAGKITMATSLFVGSWVLWVMAKTTSAAGPEGARGLPQRANPKE